MAVDLPTPIEGHRVCRRLEIHRHREARTCHHLDEAEIMKTKLNWTTDSNGLLRGPRSHDGSVTSIGFAKSRFTLEWSSVDNCRFALELLGEPEINMVYLRNGAIISDIQIWPVGSLPECTWKIPDSGWNLFFRGLLVSSSSIKEEAEVMVRRRPLAQFIQISNSYGGYIAAVCDDIEFYQY